MSSSTLQRTRLGQGLTGWCGGNGSPVLLVHGVGMQANYWLNLLPVLCESHRVIAVDLPGHGDSDLLPGPAPAISLYGDCIASILSELDMPAHLVGHSLGALIVADIADRHPDQVASVALLNAVYGRSESARQAVQKRVAQLGSSATPDPEPTLARWFGHSPTGVDKIAASKCLDWLIHMNSQGYLDAYRLFADSDGPTDAMLLAMQCPALFLTGANEPNSTPGMSHSMAAQAPHGRSVVVDHARHMMSMTHGEEVAEILLEHFAV